MPVPLVKKYRLRRAALRAEFRECIENLLQNDMVRRLDDCKQHFKYTRLRHSVDVAFLSYCLARLLRLDSRSVARAGLLHDLFFHSEGQNSASLLFSHPRIALQNAREICDLNKVEEDIILRHMFLLTLCPPRYREGYVVTVVDKLCATREFFASLFVKDMVRAL